MALQINKVQFHYLNVDFYFPSRTLAKQRIIDLIHKEGKQLEHLNYIFCTDDYLLTLNQAHLNHDTLTDIITFHYHQVGQAILSDIYISVDRVHENARIYKKKFLDELYRVMFHGALHLCGFLDKTKAQQLLMRQKEDFYLSLIS